MTDTPNLRPAQWRVAVAATAALAGIVLVQLVLAFAASLDPHAARVRLAAITGVVMLGVAILSARSGRVAVAATQFVGASACAVAITPLLFTATPAWVKFIAALVGPLVALGSGFAALGALHRLGMENRGTFRFLLAECIGIACTVWLGNAAPALVAGALMLPLYRTAPAPPPARRRRIAER